MRLASYCNSRAYFNNNEAKCGIILYNTTDPLPVNFENLGRQLQAPEEVYDCPAPNAASLVYAFNQALVEIFNTTDVSEYIVAIQQLCEIECEANTTVTTYSSVGVCAKKTNPLTRKPSKKPSKRPTRKPVASTDSPTPRETASATNEATNSPTTPPTPRENDSMFASPSDFPTYLPTPASATNEATDSPTPRETGAPTTGATDD